jgi:hypothetical protein
MPEPSAFAKKLAGIANEQFQLFRDQDEDDPGLSKQIKKWYAALGFKFESVSVPWSAVFVSWCVHNAGATKLEFEFAMAHAVFVHQAIQNGLSHTGVFQAFDISAVAPQVGDIIQNNRQGNSFDFNFARTHKKYPSHSAIVVATGQDEGGNFALTVGGNEGNAVGRKRVRLTAAGLLKQRPTNSFICVIKNLK